MADPDTEREGEDADAGPASGEGPPGDEAASSEDPPGDGEVPGDDPSGEVDPVEDLTEAELKARVEEEYDFDDFGPRDMQEMSYREWEAAFEADSWITGDELLDRVGDDLRSRIADREVFAVLEEVEEDGERRLLAYSDEGYALVYPDGGVEGFGTVVRDVKPTVALCSMESYEPDDPPADDALLPTPGEVPEGTGEFGNLMIQIIAAVQLLAGLALLAIWVAPGTGPRGAGSIAALGGGLFFFLVALFLFVTVANARLSDRFRVEEYRERLRAIGLADGERPDFLPVEDGEVISPTEREPPAVEGEEPVEEWAEDAGTPEDAGSAGTGGPGDGRDPVADGDT